MLNLLHRRLNRALPLVLAVALQAMPMIRSIFNAAPQALPPSAWSIILKLGAGTVALLGSYDAVSGASTLIVPFNGGFTVYLTNGIAYKRLLATSPNTAGSWSTNGLSSSGTTAFQLQAGFSLTNRTGYIAGTPALASGITTNNLKITGWENSNNSGASTSTNFTFITFSGTPGTLLVTASPPTAVTQAGNLTWNLDGGPWQANGSSNIYVLPGSHTVNFTNLSGWTSPAAQNITITSSALTTVSVTYSTNTSGALQVNLAPTAAVTAGAAWQVDGGAFQSSGAIVNSLSNGTHTVAFQPVNGWITPAAQNPAITNGMTNTIAATYVAIAAPVITNITLSGTTLTIKGSGTSGAGFTVLSNSSLTTPVAQWPAAASGGHILAGKFSFTTTVTTATNTRVFYRVSSQ